METEPLPPPLPSAEPWLPDPKRRPITVLMSGGVDSSVTALLLREAGLDPVGVTMLVPTPTGSKACCGAHAATVCRKLGLPHYTLDTRAAFHTAVIGPFRAAYAGGETPSPCIDCNARLKFGLVATACRAHLGIADLATGHYARVVRADTGVSLARARQRNKDQSYFIYGLPVALLEHLHLPLGELDKDAVRAQARRAGLHVAERAESQELCFAGGGDYRAALGDALPGSGPIMDPDGRELGTHRGLWNYTVGQRHGLGLGTHQPHWVLRLEPAGNRLVVGSRDAACRREIPLRACNVLQEAACHPGRDCRGKTRSGGDPVPCRIRQRAGDQLRIRFADPVFAPAPGQHCVLYDEDDRVIAGGVIYDGARDGRLG